MFECWTEMQLVLKKRPSILVAGTSGMDTGPSGVKLA